MILKSWITLKPAFTVVGLCLDSGDLPGDVDALWDSLVARYAEIPHADPDQGYGVHTFSKNLHQYLAGMAVRNGGPLPDGMIAKKLPANTYAVFVHRGLTAELAQTTEKIFTDWLPGSSYQMVGDFYFEYYDDRFQPGSLESVMFLYLPVKEMGG